MFDYKKLDWYNGMYIREKSDEELFHLLLPYMQKNNYISLEYTDNEKDKFLSIIPLIKERLKVLGDVVEMVKFLYTEDEVKEAIDLVPKKQSLEETYEALKGAYTLLLQYKDQTDEVIEEHLMQLASNLNIKVNGSLCQ